MITSFVLAVVAGWFGHKLKPGTARLFPTEGTNRLVSYAIGSLLIFIAYSILTAGRIDRTPREVALTQLLVAMLGVGLGTTLGTIIDYIGGH
jgi:hypothetical protein